MEGLEECLKQIENENQEWRAKNKILKETIEANKTEMMQLIEEMRNEKQIAHQGAGETSNIILFRDNLPLYTHQNPSQGNTSQTPIILEHLQEQTASPMPHHTET